MENDNKEMKDFIETTIKEAVSKKLDHYTIPEGYITCKDCGTIYPEDCKCPKCSKQKGDIKDESKDKKDPEKSKDGDIKDGDTKDGDIKDGDTKNGDIKDGDTKDGNTKDGDKNKSKSWHW